MTHIQVKLLSRKIQIIHLAVLMHVHHQQIILRRIVQTLRCQRYSERQTRLVVGSVSLKLRQKGIRRENAVDGESSRVGRTGAATVEDTAVVIDAVAIFDFIGVVIRRCATCIPC